MEIPQEPSEPLLADVELSYLPRRGWKDSAIRLSRITGWSEQEPQAVGEGEIQPFLLPAPAEHLVLFAFTRAKGKRKVRMYIDKALPEERIPSIVRNPDKGEGRLGNYGTELVGNPSVPNQSRQKRPAD